MEYFALQYDRQILDFLHIKIPELDLATSEPFIIPCELGDNTCAPEFFCVQKLFTYFFFVSDRLKELLDVYCKEYEAIPCFLTDMERQRQECYWMILLPEIYQTEEEEQEESKEVYVNEKLVEGRYIVALLSGRRKHVIVSLHLAEHMLRKNYYGIQYRPVQIR